MSGSCLDPNELFCCCHEVLEGRGCFLYRLLCCPIVLPYHAIRIFCGACLEIYIGWFRFASCCKDCCWHEFTDEEFPPNASSVGDLKGDTASGVLYGAPSISWVRAAKICQNEERGSQLYDGEIEAEDLLQGAIGNCWLIAALACVAERPEIMQQVIRSKSINNRGKYTFYLWDQIRDKQAGTQWVKITIDDYIPCRSDTTEPKFARANGNEIWALLIEKAFAKMYGSYKELEGGHMWWGLTALTGNTPVVFNRNNGRSWQAVTHEGYPVREDGEFQDDKFFELLYRMRRNGAFVCCSGVPQTNPMGLISGHAYSIIQLRKVRTGMTSTDYLRMVEIRNPHGGGEWKGAWSDNSNSWDNYPQVKDELQAEKKEDGAFWMQWQDFVKFWKNIHVVDCQTNIRTVAIPVYDERHSCGPVGACVRGCWDYWFCCTGLKRLYFGRKGAEDVAGMQKDLESNCYMDQAGCNCNLLHARAVEYDELSESVSDSGSEN